MTVPGKCYTIGAQDTHTELSISYWIEYHLLSQKTAGHHHAMATPWVSPWLPMFVVPPHLFCPSFINGLLFNSVFLGGHWGVSWCHRDHQKLVSTNHKRPCQILYVGIRRISTKVTSPPPISPNVRWHRSGFVLVREHAVLCWWNTSAHQRKLRRQL